MYGTVRYPFEITDDTAGMLESCSGTSKSRWHAKSARPEWNGEQATQVRIRRVDAKISRLPALLAEARSLASFSVGKTVGRAIRKTGITELPAHQLRLEISLVAVIPVRQRPVIRPAE